MNRKKLGLFGLGLSLVASSVFVIQEVEEFGFEERSSRYMAKRHGEKTEGFKGYRDWWLQRVANPETGKIEHADVYAARKSMSALLEKQAHSRQAVTVEDWTEMGPYNHGGRTRALMVDNQNTDILWAAGVSGGLFKSEDKGQNWSKVETMDEWPAIVSICQTINGDIYLGTGEGHYFFIGDGSAGIPGNGVYKSSDGGVTWSQLEDTEGNTSASSNWSQVNELVAHPSDPNTVYAATGGGVYVTNDAGVTWERMEGSATGKINDIAIALNGSEVHLHVTTESKYQRSIDGVTLMDMDDNPEFDGFPSSIESRADITVAPSNPDVVYLSHADNSGFLEGYYVSRDAGVTWEVITKGGSEFFEPFGTGQGDYDNVVSVSLNDPNEVYFGGVELWKYTSEDGINRIATIYGDNSNFFYVHADMHAVTNHPTDSNLVFFGNDGGVFASYNRGRWFSHLNNGFKTMQCYDAKMGPYGELISGFQDNGTHIIDVVNNRSNMATYTNSEHVNGGDGGEVDWSYINPNAIFGASQYGNVLRSSNKGSSFNTFFDDNLTGSVTGEQGQSATFADFVTPFELWEAVGQESIDTIVDLVLPSDSLLDTLGTNAALMLDTVIDTVANNNMFYVGIRSGVWMTREALDFSVAPEWYQVLKWSANLSEVEISGDGNTIWAAAGSAIRRVTNLKEVNYGYRWGGSIIKEGENFKVSNRTFNGDSAGLVTTVISSPSSRAITNIEVNQSNPSHVVITYGGYGGSGGRIYESKNAMDSIPTWTDISGNIDNWPVYDAVIDMDDNSRVFVGTEFGVFASENTAGGTWSFVGPHRVPVFSLDQVNVSDSLATITGTAAWSGSQLVAGTHGNGIWVTNYDVCAIYGLSDSMCQLAMHTEEHTEKVLNSNIGVYPNPASTISTVNFVTTETADITVNIYSLDGRMIYSQTRNGVSAGHQAFEVNVTDQPNGIYLVNTSVNGKVFQNKLMKMN